MKLSMEQNVGFGRAGYKSELVDAICTYGRSFPHSKLFILTSKDISVLEVRNIVYEVANKLNFKVVGDLSITSSGGVAHSFTIHGDGVSLYVLTGLLGACPGDASLPIVPPAGAGYDQKQYRVEAVQDGLPVKSEELQDVLLAFRESARQAGTMFFEMRDARDAGSACARN